MREDIGKMNDDQFLAYCRRIHQRGLEIMARRLEQRDQEDGKTDQCPSMFRVLEAGFARNWTDAEQQHMMGCAWCQKTLESVLRTNQRTS